jgi:hypothetical protein
VGLKDTPLRVERAREAFEMIKNYRGPGSVATEVVTIDDHPGLTTVFSVGNEPIARLTEYSEDGHSIGSFPFKDSMLIDWLLEQRATEVTENRIH